MRKNLKLFKEFFSKNIIKSLALLIVIVSTCIIFCSKIAEINYQFHSLSYFNKEELSNGECLNIYSCISDSYDMMYMDENGSVDMDSVNEKYSKAVESDIYRQIGELPAVDKVYSYTDESRGENLYNDSYIKLIFSNTDTYQFFNYDLSDGCWFWETEQTSEYPNVVLCGSIFGDVEVGSDIDITYLTKPYKVHVIGKVAAPYQHVEFVGDYIHGIKNTNTLFFMDDELSFKTFGSTIKRYPSAAVVQYKSDATEEEIEECHQFYRSAVYSKVDNIPAGKRIYVSSDEYMELAYDYINNDIKQLLEKDLIFSIIAIFMTIILSVLMIRSKRNEHNIYCLCGASKRKNFLISFSAIASIAVAAGIICSIYMLNYSYMISNGMVSVSDIEFRFEWNCYAVMWLYLLVVSLISSVIPFIMLVRKKMTLITLYRKK